MRANARDYREHLYRTRAHPHRVEGFRDQRNSFITVYLSLVPFLALEFFAEKASAMIPAGLVFPMGYLLFWAFYYTYYKPGFLEERLSTPAKWDLMAIPTILMGVTIWFVKVTVVELSGFFLKGVFRVGSTSKARPRPTGVPPRRETSYANDPRRHSGQFQAQPARPGSLPLDILGALSILGLEANADWGQIHRRYRELAKQFHPDLNREVTHAGRRFMLYDSAYRKLLKSKDLHFPERRSHA